MVADEKLNGRSKELQMVSYPVSIPMPRGGLPRDYHPSAGRELRRQLEDYLNERAKDSPETVLTYAQIASATGTDKEYIKLFLKPLTGSHGGITIVNSELKNETGNPN